MIKWLTRRAIKSAIVYLRWRIPLTLAIIGLAWLIATYTIWR